MKWAVLSEQLSEFQKADLLVDSKAAKKGAQKAAQMAAQTAAYSAVLKVSN